MSQNTANETYHFYYPIYNLRNPSNNIKLGYSTILTFLSLPKKVQERFLIFWKNYFTIYTEYARTEEEYISRKKTVTFLHLDIEATSDSEAFEKASNCVKESVSILNFLYGIYFPIYHCISVKNSESVGGFGDYYYNPSLWIGEYQSKYEADISKLTGILTKPNSEIDKKIRNTLVIFGIQESVTNEQVRFVLLTTCLESLLMSNSDRECLSWKLAEKTAFLSENKKIVYEEIKSAYDKRSAFIHGSPSSRKTIVEDDLVKMQGTVISILRKLMQFKEMGYSKMKEVNEYIDKLKFEEKIS
jgi:hypothetical protein